MSEEFTGKVCVVTGGGSGLGAATARLLALRGGEVWFADRDLAAARVASEGLPRARAISLDVTEPAGWARLSNEIKSWHVLVNAAGITGARANGGVADATLDSWRNVFAVNLEGVLLGCQAAMRTMREGAIVNIASTAAMSPSHALGAYGASKAAVAQLTLSVAAQLAVDGRPIRCNAVAPGMADTPMTGGMADPHRQAWEAQIPLGRFARADEIAETIVFLASNRAAYITGTILRADGGLLTRPVVRSSRP